MLLCAFFFVDDILPKIVMKVGQRPEESQNVLAQERLLYKLCE